MKARHQRAEHLVVSGHAGGAHRRHGHPVIGVNARDDLGLCRLVFDLPVIAREFEGGFIGFGAGGREINRRRIGIGVAHDLFAEPHRRLVGLADIGRGKGDAAHLRGGGVGQFAPAMTDIDVPQPRQAVDVFAAVGIVQHRTSALGDDQRLPVIVGMMQRVNQIAPIGFDQLGGAVHLLLLKTRAPCPHPYRAGPAATTAPFAAGSAPRRRESRGAGFCPSLSLDFRLIAGPPPGKHARAFYRRHRIRLPSRMAIGKKHQEET